jgi:hypothetical protein
MKEIIKVILAGIKLGIIFSVAYIIGWWIDYFLK